MDRSAACKIEKASWAIDRMGKLEADFRGIVDNIINGVELDFFDFPAGGTGMVEVDMIEGRGAGRNLLTIPGVISAGDWWSSAGAIFPGHEHPEKEWLIVYQGELRLFYEDGQSMHLRPRDSWFNEPGVWHSAFFPEETRYLAITQPHSDAWPKYE